MRCLVALIVLLSVSMSHAQTAKRAAVPEDYLSLRDVGDPNLSPDGTLVAYVAKSVDVKADKMVARIWLAALDGSCNRALTFGDKNATHPRFSPDGKWVAFLSSRDDENDVDQLWLLPLDFGESQKITSEKGGIDDFVWAPDSKRVLLVVRDPDSKRSQNQPILIDRFRFKQDGDGYLTGRFSHLYLLTLEGRRVEQMTSGPHDESMPSWSPDGTQIVYVSKRGEEAERGENWDLYIMVPKAGAPEQQLTTDPTADANPEWESYPAFSPDGRYILYLKGGDPKKISYAATRIAMVSRDGKQHRVLTPDLDRNTYFHRWSANGRFIYCVLEDDGEQVLVKISLKDGSLTRLTKPGLAILDFDLGASDKIVLRMSSPSQPEEVFSFEDYKNLSKQNEGLRQQLNFAKMEKSSFKSKDGTEVHGFIMKPTSALDGANKALLRLHGGPASQFSQAFSLQLQILAAQGYTLILPNPRGSSGRGTDYAMAIYADWGNKDLEDNLAAIDSAIAKGLVDPERLGVGGWSYGGISTNYLIASTSRFKAAVSGASISNIFAGYGTDQFVYEYETELGTPWTKPETWKRLSYPFYHADRIRTPTLFLCGESDGNVPLINSEQMYQALKSLKVPTELVVYPGQYHSITKPSYLVDRVKRYVAWYAKWIK